MPNSRRHLYVIFSDKPDQAVHIDRTWLRGLSADEAFDKANQAGALFDRRIRAMWVVDRTAAEEVRRVHGEVPAEIHDRYEAFLNQAE